MNPTNDPPPTPAAAIEERDPAKPDLSPFDAAGVRLRIGDFVLLSRESTYALPIVGIRLTTDNEFLVEIRLPGEGRPRIECADPSDLWRVDPTAPSEPVIDEALAAQLRRAWEAAEAAAVDPPAPTRACCSQASLNAEAAALERFEDVGGFVLHSAGGDSFLVCADGAVKVSKVVHLRRLARVSAPEDYIEVELDDGKSACFLPWPRGGRRLPTSPSVIEDANPAQPPPREIVPAMGAQGRRITIGDRVHRGGGPVMRVDALEIDRLGQVLAGCLYPRKDGAEIRLWFLPGELVKLQEDSPEMEETPPPRGSKDAAAGDL